MGEEEGANPEQPVDDAADVGPAVAHRGEVVDRRVHPLRPAPRPPPGHRWSSPEGVDGGRVARLVWQGRNGGRRRRARALALLDLGSGVEECDGVARSVWVRDAKAPEPGVLDPARTNHIFFFN